MSWEQYGAIVQQAAKERQEERQRIRQDCPVCGEPLEFNSAGVANCPLGHFRSKKPTYAQ